MAQTAEPAEALLEEEITRQTLPGLSKMVKKLTKRVLGTAQTFQMMPVLAIGRMVELRNTALTRLCAAGPTSLLHGHEKLAS